MLTAEFTNGIESMNIEIEGSCLSVLFLSNIAELVEYFQKFSEGFTCTIMHDGTPAIIMDVPDPSLLKYISGMKPRLDPESN